jgi:hypothetical protein
MSDPRLDAVGLVRQIRDQIYEETKSMSREELITFYRRHAAPAKDRLRHLQSEREEVSKGRT